VGFNVNGAGGDGLADNAKDLFAFFAFKGEPRGAGEFGAVSAFGDGEFDVLDELGMGIEVEERGIPAVDIAGLFEIALGCQVPDEAVFGGEGVDEAGDPAVDAEDEAFEDEIVDAGEDEEAIADGVVEVGDAADVFGGFLDGDDGGGIGEFGEHGGGDIDAVADGIVVNHDGEVGGGGDGLVVGDGFARVGFVDHAGEDHETVDAGFFGVGGELAGEGGGVFGDAGEDGEAAVDVIDGGLEELDFFVVGEGAIFADGAEHDEAVDTGIDHGVEVGEGAGEVEGLLRVIVDVGDGGGEDAVPGGLIGWSVHRFIGWSVGRLVGWSVGRF
jgi:hypothetical protein